MPSLPPLVDREQSEEMLRLRKNLDAVARATAEADRAWLELSREYANEDAARWRPWHEGQERLARLDAERDRLKALYVEHGGTDEGFEERWRAYRDDRAFQAAVEATELTQAQSRRQL